MELTSKIDPIELSKLVQQVRETFIELDPEHVAIVMKISIEDQKSIEDVEDEKMPSLFYLQRLCKIFGLKLTITIEKQD